MFMQTQFFFQWLFILRISIYPPHKTHCFFYLTKRELCGFSCSMKKKCLQNKKKWKLFKLIIKTNLQRENRIYELQWNKMGRKKMHNKVSHLFSTCRFFFVHNFSFLLFFCVDSAWRKKSHKRIMVVEQYAWLFEVNWVRNGHQNEFESFLLNSFSKFAALNWVFLKIRSENSWNSLKEAQNFLKAFEKKQHVFEDKLANNFKLQTRVNQCHSITFHFMQ